jgi:ABC-type oligopeptide transport system substrate-binding subunit
MTALTRSTSLLAARTSLAVVMLSFMAFGAWTAGGLLGQPPAQKKERLEEEEEAPKANKPKRKVIHVPGEEDSQAKAKPGTNRPSAPAEGGDLAQLAELATHPAIKALFRSLAVPHDVVLYKPTSVTIGGKQRPEDKIVPIPFYLGKAPGRYDRQRLHFTPLTLDWKQGKPYEPLIENLQSVRPYEEIAQEEVRRFLRESHKTLSRIDMLIAAEQVLSAVLRWHESAIQTGKRNDKEWQEVGKALRKQLLEEVLLEQMKLLAQDQNWDRVLELTHRLAVSYGKDAEHQRIFQPVADMINKALGSPTASEEQKQKALERLHELETEFPGNPAFEPLSNTLKQQAEILLKQAQEEAAAKHDKRARGLLEQAKRTWPQLPGLLDFEAKLNTDHPILRVGVRGPLPKYFSPALACTDNERRAVEMLFESLVKQVPDGSGGFRYSGGLAESYMKVVPLGRQFQLPTKAVWSNSRPLTPGDIKRSLEFLKEGKGVGRSRLWGDLLAEVEQKKDPFQLTLRLKQGFLDPLAPMTFKILPPDQPLDSEEFARNPVTSGPFLLGPRMSDENRRDCLSFVANPYYRLRPGKRDLPHIQEIRFYSYNHNSNIAADLDSHKLDLVLDLTAKETEGLLKNPNANITVPMPSPAVPNRRIYFLAINTRKLTSPDLRQALSSAINREALLNKHFRIPGQAGLHKALNGPFPAGSWACKDSPELFNRDNANVLKNDPDVLAAAKSGPWVLKYASDNPALDEAIKELCDQVKELTGVELEPKLCDPYQLREDVEQTKNYDLAYYHYDFPDESYWLGPLFGPPPGREDNTNIFKYQNEQLSQLLEGTKSHRNFAKVQEHQRVIHTILNREMPFIPLWQLDPLLAYRREVEPVTPDPLLLFGNIEEWRIKRK